MKKHIIKLTESEKKNIESLLKQKRCTPGVRDRALILRASDNGLKDKEISEFTGMTVRTICNVRKNFCKKGFRKTVFGEAIPGRPKKFDEKDKAELIALACSNPPEGCARWTLELLRGKMSKQITSGRLSPN